MRVRVTLPEVISGVYVAFKLFTSLKVPEGADHVPEVAPPPITPESTTDSPSQTVMGFPALAVGSKLTEIVMFDEDEGHGPGGWSGDSVRITLPLVIAGV